MSWFLVIYFAGCAGYSCNHGGPVSIPMISKSVCERAAAEMKAARPEHYRFHVCVGAT